MRFTKNDFWLLKKLDKAGCTRQEIAERIGCKPNSISQYKKFETWEDYCEYKSKHAKEVRDRKQYAQEDLREVYTANENPTVMDMYSLLAHELADLKELTRQLIGWEERKQAQKEEYWAKQREQKRSYFNRWNNEQ